MLLYLATVLCLLLYFKRKKTGLQIRLGVNTPLDMPLGCTQNALSEARASRARALAARVARYGGAIER